MHSTLPILRTEARVLWTASLAVAAFLAVASSPAHAETQVVSVPATIEVESRTSSDGHNCGTRVFVQWPAQENAVAWKVYYFDNEKEGSDPVSKSASPPFDDFAQIGDDPNRIWQAPEGFHWEIISQTSRSAPGMQVSCADFEAYHEARWMPDRVDVTVEAPDTEVENLNVVASKSQKVKGKKTKVKASVSANEAITTTATGDVKIKGMKGTVELTPQTKSVEGGERAVMKLTPVSKAGEKKIRKAVKRYRKASRKKKQKIAVKARLRLETTDLSGNSLTAKRVIALK